MTIQEKQEFIKANYGKMSATEMCTHLLMSTGAIRSYLKRIGLRKSNTYSIEKLKGMYESDMSVADIANELGVTTGTIYNKARKCGIKRKYNY